jgi:hypothetical protein
MLPGNPEMSSKTPSLDTLKPDSDIDKKADLEVQIENVENVAISKSVFDDEKLALYYKPREDYEGYHRFDPKAVWTVEEERILVRKIDWRIMLWCCIMFSALQLDRGNIGKHTSILHLI